MITSEFSLILCMKLLMQQLCTNRYVSQIIVNCQGLFLWRNDASISWKITFNNIVLFLGNATVCRQVTNPGSLRDVEWATQSCLLSFNTIGIWPETMDGTDLSTCAKSNGSKLMATGDDFGKIKVYSFPVTQPKVISRKKGKKEQIICSSDKIRRTQNEHLNIVCQNLNSQ